MPLAPSGDEANATDNDNIFNTTHDLNDADSGFTPEAELFSRVRFIMVQPSHPGNVGAAARALKTMGFHSLYLVTPRFPDVVNLPEAQALASGAADVLSSVRIVPTLADALAPVSLAFALTARARLLGPPPRSEEHTSELQSLMRTSYAVF